MRNRILALLAVVFLSCGSAHAAPPYTGNTSGTDSAAILNAVNDIDANTGMAATGGATAANQALTNTKLDTLHTDLTSPNASPIKGDVVDGGVPGTSGVEQSCVYTATPTTYTDTFKIPLRCDKNGNAIIRFADSSNLVSGSTAAMTGTTTTAVTGMGAPGAGLFNYITTITCSNSHAIVGTWVDLQDGSGGTVFGPPIPAAINYGGAVMNLTAPLKQPTANTALFVVDETTGANVKCGFVGYKAP